MRTWRFSNDTVLALLAVTTLLAVPFVLSAESSSTSSLSKKNDSGSVFAEVTSTASISIDEIAVRVADILRAEQKQQPTTRYEEDDDRTELFQLHSEQIELKEEYDFLSLQLEEVSETLEQLQSLIGSTLLPDKNQQQQQYKQPLRKLQGGSPTPAPGTTSGCTEKEISKLTQRLTKKAAKQNSKENKAVTKAVTKLNSDLSSMEQSLMGLGQRTSKLEQSIATLVNTINQLAQKVGDGNGDGSTNGNAGGGDGSVEDPGTTGGGGGGQNPSARCGCDTCTDVAWDTQAPQGAGPDYTCGKRIQFMMTQGLAQLDACAFVSNEFPDGICAPCDPNKCSTEVYTPAENTGGGSNVNAVALTPAFNHYCYPPWNQRVQYDNVWGDFMIQVKSDPNGGLCGPGNNKFVESNIQLKGDEMTFEYKPDARGVWSASEVRIVLPEEKMPFRYGKYSFSVKSIAVIDTSTNVVVSDVLPADLTLGLFTWDSTENYAIHENWNHEVDIELARWGDPNKADGDAQFLVQPAQPGIHWKRFFSGAGNSYDQGGHVYEFTWEPNRILWSTSAGGGVTHELTSQKANEVGQGDYIQCLPADVEVRINLWNFKGALMPEDMKPSQKVQVVIDNFSYTPSVMSNADDGDFCSKNCQCASTSKCVGGICTSTMT